MRIPQSWNEELTLTIYHLAIFNFLILRKPELLTLSYPFHHNHLLRNKTLHRIYHRNIVKNNWLFDHILI